MKLNLPSWEVKLVCGWCEDEADSLARKIVSIRKRYMKSPMQAFANQYADVLEENAANLLRLRRKLLEL